MMNSLYERRDLANRFKAHCRSDSKHKRLEACVDIAPSFAGHGLPRALHTDWRLYSIM